MALLGDAHPHTLATLNNLAGVLKEQGRLDEAEPMYRRALETLERVNGEQHPNTLAAMNNLATLLVDLGRLDDAEPLFRGALRRLREVLDEGHPTVLGITHNLANLLRRQGKLDQAAAMFRDLLETTERSLPENHWYRWGFQSTYGLCLTEMKRYHDAEDRLLPAYQGLRSVFGQSDPHTLTAAERLVELYERWGKSDRAAEYRALLAQPGSAVGGSSENPSASGPINNGG